MEKYLTNYSKEGASFDLEAVNIKRQLEDQNKRAKQAQEKQKQQLKEKEKESYQAEMKKELVKEDGSIGLEWETEYLVKRAFYVEDTVSGVWPKTTAEVCRWDLQPFTGTPIGIPCNYDHKTGKFNLFGYFCSFNCAMAYDKKECGGKRAPFIKQLARDFYKEHYDAAKIRCAPPRIYLSKLHAEDKDMGKAIAKFRGASSQYLFTPHPAPPFVRVTEVYDEEKVLEQARKNHEEHVKQLSQPPKPIARTSRGIQQQRKYVLSKSCKKAKTAKGAIDFIMGIEYVKND